VPHLDIDPPKMKSNWNDHDIINTTIFQSKPEVDLSSDDSDSDWMEYVYGIIFIFGIICFYSALRRRQAHVSAGRANFTSHITP